MSLVAPKAINPVNPLEGDAPDINDGGAKVVIGSFWPEIILADLRRSMRMNGQVTTDRLQHQAIEAAIQVTKQLAGWKAEQEAAGYAALSAVPSEAVNGVTALVFRFNRAVYCATKALLTEGYRDIDTTRDGEKHAAALASQIDTLWRDSNWAVRDIQGETRGLAELV